MLQHHHHLLLPPIYPPPLSHPLFPPSDRVAGLAGGAPNPKVVTFRGTYYQMKQPLKGLVSANVYPVPSGGGIPVGVHFTPTVNERRGHQLIIGPGEWKKQGPFVLWRGGMRDRVFVSLWICLLVVVSDRGPVYMNAEKGFGLRG